MNDNEKNNEFEEFLKLFKESDSSGSDTPVIPRKQPEQVQTSATPRSEYPARRKKRRRKPGKYLSPKPKAPKKRRQHRLTVITVILVSVMILSFVMIVRSCSSAGDALKGTWDIDGVTVYQFDGKGNGALILPSNTYPFIYGIKDNAVSIDFESDAARDITYSFTVEKDKLIMVSTEDNHEKTFELTKMPDEKYSPEP